jgi:hypothetical protein
LALTDRSDKLTAFRERFSAKPLLAIELNRTDKGFELQSAKAGFLIWDWSIFEKPSVPAGQKAATTSASTPAAGGKPGVGSASAPNGGNSGGPPPIPPKPRKPLPPIPGTATAAANINANAGSPPPIPPKPAALRAKPIAPSGKAAPSGGGTHPVGPKPAPDSDAP